MDWSPSALVESAVSFDRRAIVSIKELKEAIWQNAIDYVIQLRSSSSVTILTCEQAVQVRLLYPTIILTPCILFFQAADELVETIVGYLTEETRSFLHENTLSIDTQPLLKLFDEVRKPLKFLSTDKRHRQSFMSRKRVSIFQDLR